MCLIFVIGQLCHAQIYINSLRNIFDKLCQLYDNMSYMTFYRLRYKVSHVTSYVTALKSMSKKEVVSKDMITP